MFSNLFFSHADSFLFCFLFSLCSAGAGLEIGCTHSSLGSQKCCYQHRADLPDFCKPLSSTTAERGPESKGKCLHFVYQENSNLSFDFKPSLSVLIKSPKHIGPEQLIIHLCVRYAHRSTVVFSYTRKRLVLTAWKWSFLSVTKVQRYTGLSK